MRQRLQKLKDRLQEQKVKRDYLSGIYNSEVEKEKRLQQLYDDCLQARTVLQSIAKQTQSKLEFHISGLVTTALAAVFDEPYEFIARFVEKRNRTECDLIFRKNGRECDPFSASGGGVIDVASFALRVSVWSIKKTRNILILDEPFKFVSVDLQPKCSEMMKELSKRLKLQMLMVSHLPNIINAADCVIYVKQEKGVSSVS